MKQPTRIYRFVVSGPRHLKWFSFSWRREGVKEGGVDVCDRGGVVLRFSRGNESLLVVGTRTGGTWTVRVEPDFFGGKLRPLPKWPFTKLADANGYYYMQLEVPLDTQAEFAEEAACAAC